MLQTSYKVDDAYVSIDTNTALEMLDLPQCEEIINAHSEFTDEEDFDKCADMIAKNPNCCNHYLYLIALNVMETKYPVQFAQAKLEHDADRYEPEYPQ